MNKNKLIASVAAISIVAAFFATPYISVNSMEKAIAEHDSQRLTELVDFPVLKENLKGAITAKFTAEMAKSGKNDIGSNLGFMMASAFISPMIDAMVSPQGLASMMRGGKPLEGGKQETGDKLSDDPNTVVTMGYKAFNTFAVDIKDKASQKVVTLIFNRANVISWRLSDVRFPQEL